MLNLFHKNKKNIDDILQLVNVVNMRLDRQLGALVLGFGEPILVYGQNYTTTRSPLRIYINSDLKIIKMELEQSGRKNKLYKQMDKIISDIKINSEFKCSNDILMFNINDVLNNLKKFSYIYESDILNKKINCEKYINQSKKYKNWGINYILF